MYVVHQADEIITKIWGDGKPQPGVFRLMRYLVSAEIDGGMLLHNTVTGELIFLENAEARQLAALPCEYAPWMDPLIQKRFLVQTKADDRKNVEKLRFALRTLNHSSTITGYTVLPTTCCNARCFYCYEAGIKHETMSDETADQLVEFMVSHCGNKPLSIHWFGGEPLLGVRQIDRICRALTGRKIAFTSAMISNGYLVDEEMVNRAKTQWNLKKIQITLDGTEDIYNRTKAYVSPCASPYRRVLDNIALLLEQGIRVDIRLNLGLHNAGDLSALVKKLDERFEDKSRLGIYAHLLFDDCGKDPVHFDPEDLKTLYDREDALTEEIRQHAPAAYTEKLPKLKSNRCMVDNDASVVVVPSGKFGKCEHYAETHFVGSLDSGISDQKELEWCREQTFSPECDDCPLFPACIHLKLCVDHPCVDGMVQRQIAKTIRTMKFYYDNFRRHKELPTDRAETPDC